MITDTYLPPYKIAYIEGYLFDLKRLYQEIVDHHEYFIGCCSPPSIVGNRVQGGIQVAPQDKLLYLQEASNEFQEQVRTYSNIIEGLEYLKDLALDEGGVLWDMAKMRYFHGCEPKEICDHLEIDRSCFYRMRERICLLMKPYMPAP